MIDSEHHKLPQVSLAKPVAHATAVNWPHIDVTDADGKHLHTVFDVGMGRWRLCPGSRRPHAGRLEQRTRVAQCEGHEALAVRIEF